MPPVPPEAKGDEEKKLIFAKVDKLVCRRTKIVNELHDEKWLLPLIDPALIISTAIKFELFAQIYCW